MRATKYDNNIGAWWGENGVSSRKTLRKGLSGLYGPEN